MHNGCNRYNHIHCLHTVIVHCKRVQGTDAKRKSKKHFALVTAVLQEKDLYIATSGAIFYYFDEEVYADAMERLSTSCYEITSSTEDTFTGTLHVDKGQELIYTSIPYDAGWVVKIDGAVVETEEIVGALLGFRTVPGDHTLELEYRPSCVKYGTYISLAGLSAFALLCLGEWISRRHKKKSVDMR